MKVPSFKLPARFQIAFTKGGYSVTKPVSLFSDSMITVFEQQAKGLGRQNGIDWWDIGLVFQDFRDGASKLDRLDDAHKECIVAVDDDSNVCRVFPFSTQRFQFTRDENNNEPDGVVSLSPMDIYIDDTILFPDNQEAEAVMIDYLLRQYGRQALLGPHLSTTALGIGFARFGGLEVVRYLGASQGAESQTNSTHYSAEIRELFALIDQLGDRFTQRTLRLVDQRALLLTQTKELDERGNLVDLTD